MTNENGEVHVGGNFAVASDNYYYNDLSAGTMYITGDFRDVSGSFCAYDTHKVVLNRKGKATQTAKFDKYNERECHFNILELTRTNDHNHYVFIPDPCWVTLIAPDPPVFSEPDFVLPAALKQINEEAFEGIDAKIVDVPGTCTDIGAHAFRNSSIEQIRIPAGCTIEEDAFDGCEFVLVFGTVGSSAQAYCDTHDNCEFWEQ